MTADADSSPEPKKTRSRELLALAILLPVGAALRTTGLFSFWVNPDEGIYFAIAHGGAESWVAILDNAHPPLYYLLLKAFASIGLGSFSLLRLISFVAGVGAIYWVYRFGRELGGAAPALLGALLMALSPSLIDQSQLMRPYSVLLFFLAAAACFLARTLRTRSSRDLAVFTVFSALALLTHYSAFLVVGAQGLLVGYRAIRQRAPREERLRLLCAGAVLGALMLALLLFHAFPLMGSAMHRSAQDGWLQPFFTRDPGAAAVNVLGVVRYVVGVPAALPALVLVVIGAVYGYRREQPLAWALPLALLGCHLLASALGQYPLGCTRHSLFWAVFVFPLLGLGLAGAFHDHWLKLALVIGLVGAFGLRNLENSRWLRPTKEFVADRSTVEAAVSKIPHDAVVLMNNQTYNFLAPYSHEWSAERFEPDPQWIRFRWGERVVIASRDWNGLDAGATNRWEPVDAAAGQAPSGPKRSVWIVNGGWGVAPIADLIELDRTSSPSERRVTYPIYIANGVQAIQVRVRPPKPPKEDE